MTFPPCTLHKISEHIWWYTPEDYTDRPSLAAVVGSERVAILDIGASVAHTTSFLEALTQAGIVSPDFAVLTHWHWDHVFGIDALDCPVIAHEETAENLQRMMTLDYSDANLPNLVEQGHEVPFTQTHLQIELTDNQRRKLRLREADITFTKQLTLHLGNVSCDIQHVAGDHASDAVIIYIPEDKVLFLGDCFYYTVYQLPEHYTAAKLLPLIDHLESFDAQTYIWGHGGELLSREDMQEEFTLLREIYRLLDRDGSDNLDSIKAELAQHYDEDEINDYLTPILAGIDV